MIGRMADAHKTAPERVVNRLRATAGITLASAARIPRPSGAARRAGALVGNVPGPLKILLVVAFLQSIAWNLALPAFQGPDEVGHFAYVQHVAETGELPHVASGSKPESTDVQE